MNRTALVLRNLRYHWRGNAAVLLGAAVGAAVLSGALLVGDSLRGSLRDRTERQLGDVDCVLVGGRFVRADLAEQLPGRVRPAVLLQGAVTLRSQDAERRAGKVTVWGVDRRFGINDPAFDGDEPVAVLSAPLAKTLRARAGDRITVGVQKASAMPRSSLLSKRGVGETTRTITLTVKAVLSDDDPANSFSLSIAPTLSVNMFVPIARLQREIGQEGRANALLASGQPAQSLQSELAKKLTVNDWDVKPGVAFAASPAVWVAKKLGPDDWGLKVWAPPSHKGYFSVESGRLLLEPAVVDAVEKTARDMGLRSARTYVYLANSIAYGKQEIPYSIVAALDPAEGAPLGPFLPDGVSELRENDIVLADWKDAPFRVGPDARDPKITVSYYKPEVESKIEQSSHVFNFRGYVPLRGPAGDRYLTPDFPGITDKADLKSWDPPFEIDQQKIKRRDETFWDEYRTTPKAYIRFEDGRRLWGTRFGRVTSVRVAPPEGGELYQASAEFTARLRDNLDPAEGGLTFQPIRERMLEAGRGSTDFGMLFLAFSFFLIAAALMLVGLLFRLNLDRRAAEIGLLRAAGFPLRAVRWMLLVEGLLLAAVGAAVGLAGALWYADALIRLLVRLWPTQSVGTYLRLHVTPLSLAVGFVAAVAASGLAILWALRALKRVAPSQLLKGDITPEADPSKSRRASRWPLGIAFVGLAGAGALALMAPKMPAGEAQAGTFFGSGALLLAAGLSLLWWWMKRPRHALVAGHGAAALAKFGARNAVRNPTRSILTAGLLASAAFLLVAVESFRRQPEKDFGRKNGGSGGFLIYAESATPIDFDLNDEEGREQIAEGLRRRYQEIGLAADARQERLEQARSLLEQTTVHRFRVQGGDDASCLNLYQANRPRLFGVPGSIIDRGGFAFADSLARKAEDEANPWRLLAEPAGDAVPCVVEQNTATWMLKKGLGDTFEVPDEDNRPVKLRIVALLKDSIFQSEVLIPDAAFREHFSRTEGFGFFLIDARPDQIDRVANTLSRALGGYGFEVSPARARVAAYLAVQNTYLTTFQLLGGFGLLLGVVGLAVVLLRSVWERRAELALLRAVGYRTRTLNAVVLLENGLLLVLGLAAGVLAALAAIAPHLGAGGGVPWNRLVAMLGLAFAVGLTVVVIAALTTLRAPLIPALRKE